MKRYLRFKRIGITGGIIAGVVILVVILMSFVRPMAVFLRFVYGQHKIFETLGDFSKLAPITVATSVEDDHLRDLQYSEKYSSCVVYKGREYFVHAYIFPDNQTAKEYYYQDKLDDPERIISMPNIFEFDYTMQSDPTKAEYMALYYTHVYRVIGERSTPTIHFIKWLNKEFPILIPNIFGSALKATEDGVFDQAWNNAEENGLIDQTIEKTEGNTWIDKLYNFIIDLLYLQESLGYEEEL